MKKVLLIVVDACTSRVLAPALESGRLPRLRELARAGRLYPDCAAIFPSMFSENLGHVKIAFPVSASRGSGWRRICNMRYAISHITYRRDSSNPGS